MDLTGAMGGDFFNIGAVGVTYPTTNTSGALATATRVDALQATLLELSFEQRALQERIEVLEQSLADVQAERDAKIDGLQRERNELLEQLDIARAEAKKTAARLRELEGELAALKQIDMQRQP